MVKYQKNIEKNKFKHKTDLNIPDIKATTKDGIRLYETPEGKLYPSITTVLKNRNKKGLHEWRERVGDDVANYIARKSATRGTQVHHFCEDYLNNDLEKVQEKKKGRFLSYCLFSQLKPYLDECIGLVHCQEQTLWHDYYKIAGRVDCIAEWDGKISVIDFKTSAKPKRKEWIENYFIQETAYAKMFEELTGEKVHSIITMIAVSDGSSQMFHEKPSEKYVEKLGQLRNQYRDEYGL